MFKKFSYLASTAVLTSMLMGTANFAMLDEQDNNTTTITNREPSSTEPAREDHEKSTRTFSSQVQQLSQENPFAFFDLPISSQEWEVMQRVGIRANIHAEHPRPIVCNLFEPIENIVSGKVKQICDGTDEELRIVCGIIEKIVREVVSHFNVSGYHISFRADSSLDKKGYHKHNWHIDGIEPERDITRVGVALKGPHTAFYPFPSNRSRGELKSYLGNWELKKLDLDPSKIQHAGEREGAVFLKGDKKGALHSIPLIKPDEDRLFIQIEPVSFK